METSVRPANAIRAIAVGINGDLEGLPWLEKIESFMDQSKHVRDVNR